MKGATHIIVVYGTGEHMFPVMGTDGDALKREYKVNMKMVKSG
jgi:hypothetical protein